MEEFNLKFKYKRRECLLHLWIDEEGPVNITIVGDGGRNLVRQVCLEPDTGRVWLPSGWAGQVDNPAENKFREPLIKEFIGAPVVVKFTDWTDTAKDHTITGVLKYVDPNLPNLLEVTEGYRTFTFVIEDIETVKLRFYRYGHRKDTGTEDLHDSSTSLDITLKGYRDEK